MMDSGLIIRDESRMRWTCLQGLLKDGRCHVEVMNVIVVILLELICVGGYLSVGEMNHFWYNSNASYHVQNLFSWIITSDWGHFGWCTNKYELFEWVNWIFWFFRIINFNWKIKWLSDASENIRKKRGSLREIIWARMDMHENYDLQFALEGYKRMVRCMTRWEWI